MQSQSAPERDLSVRLAHIAEPIVQYFGQACVERGPEDHFVLVTEEPHGCVAASAHDRFSMLANPTLALMHEYLSTPAPAGAVRVIWLLQSNVPSGFQILFTERSADTFFRAPAWILGCN